MHPKLKYKVFKSGYESWDSLFSRACEFANLIGRENVLNISHSCHNNDGVVTVWYWEIKQTEQLFGINQVNFGE